MRPFPRLLLAAAAAVMAVTQPVPASSQSFFEALFGTSTPGPTPPVRFRPSNSLLPPPTYSPYRPQRDEDGESRQSGIVRTMCVRLCDGFYFPINFSVPRHRVSRDADICASSCGSEARIFFAPSPNGDIKDAHDLTGRAYTSLANAFVYRKRQVAGCTCRPAPWSEAERNRHRRYAIAEGVMPESASGDVRVVAGAGRDGLTPPEVIAGKPVTQPPAEPPVVADAGESVPASEATPVPRAPHDEKPPRSKSARKDLVGKATLPPKRTKFASQNASPPLLSQAKYSWPGDARVR